MHAHKKFFWLLSVVFLVTSPLLLNGSADGSPAPKRGIRSAPLKKSGGASNNTEVSLKRVSELMEAEHFSDAMRMARTVGLAAQAGGDEKTAVRALVAEARAKSALDGLETAAELLAAAPIPSAVESRARLMLALAASLTQNMDVYQRDIARREITESSREKPLSMWSFQEISDAVNEAYQRLWDDRRSLAGIPFSELEDVLIRSDFPVRIRPTVREAAVYLWIDFLADQSRWLPAQRSGSYSLQPQMLLPSAPSGKLAESLQRDGVSAANHPLIRLSAILEEQENFHRQNGNGEAALESLRVRFMSLWKNGSHSQKKSLEEAFEKRIGEFRGEEWWSMASCTLAEYLRFPGTDSDEKKSLELAIAGQDAYPDSAGASLCRKISEDILRTEVSFTAKALDGARKRSIEITHRNAREIFFRIYDADLFKFAEGKSQKDLDIRELTKRIVSFNKPIAAWKISLIDPGDYKSHTTFAVPPVDNPGIYLIAASLDEDFRQDRAELMARPFIVSDLAVLRDSSGGGHTFRVLNADNGAPVQGADVDIYFKKDDSFAPYQKTLSGKTDAAGEFRISALGSGRFFAKASKDGQVTIDAMPAWSQPPQALEGTGEARNQALFFTDRSVYRPGQKIFWKVIPYRKDESGQRFRTLSKVKFTLALLDASGQKVGQKSIQTNAFGSASGSFDLPEGRELGTWSIRASLNQAKGAKGGVWLGSKSFQVEEYRRPTFLVDLEAAGNQGGGRLNAPVEITGRVTAFSGIPLPEGQVVWTVERTIRPPFFNTSEHFGVKLSGGDIIASGTSDFGSGGKFSLKFTPEVDPALEEKMSSWTWAFRVKASVTSAAGETQTAEKTFVYGWNLFRADIQVPGGFIQANRGGTANLVTTTHDGIPVRARGTCKIFSLAMPWRNAAPADIPRQCLRDLKTGNLLPGDQIRSRDNPDYLLAEALNAAELSDQAASSEIESDDRGRSEIAIPKLPSGAYRIRCELPDSSGRLVRAEHHFIAAASSASLDVPLALLSDKTVARPGETIRVFAHSGRINQRMLFEIFRSGKRISHRWIVSGKDPSLFDIAVRKDDVGGFTVRLSAVMDWQTVVQSLDIDVPREDRILSLSDLRIKKSVYPGTRQKISLKLSDDRGSAPGAGSVEVLGFAYDKSLDVFGRHIPQGISKLFSTGFGAPFLDRGSLSHIYWMQRWGKKNRNELGSFNFSPDRHRRFQSAGLFQNMGGISAAAYAKNALDSLRRIGEIPQESRMPQTDADGGGSLENSSFVDQAAYTRKDFRETAFWIPAAAPANGKISFDFTVPDALTTWKFWAVAISRNLDTGITSAEFVSSRPMMVHPAVPGFFREGDEAELAVIVDNDSESKLSGTIDLSITSVQTGEDLLSAWGIGLRDSRKKFSAEQGGSARVSFKIKVPAGLDQVKITAVARSDDRRHSDGEDRIVPVLPSRVHFSESLFAALKGDRRSLSFSVPKEDQSLIHESLTLNVEGGLFDAILEAVPVFEEIPFESSIETASRLSAAAALDSLFRSSPDAAKRARALAALRRGQNAPIIQPDLQGRRTALEETPWLRSSLPDKPVNAADLLDPKARKTFREKALRRLRGFQDKNGSFSWWKGGVSSPEVTLQILDSLRRTAEAGNDIPKDIAARAWHSMAKWYSGSDLAAAGNTKDASSLELENAVFLNFLAACFDRLELNIPTLPAEEQSRLTELAFQRRSDLSRHGRARLALTLYRKGRVEDAKTVFDVIMDAARVSDDLGVYWQPEEQSWLWYRDTISFHALAIRVLTEIAPEDTRREGLIQWLLLNRKQNAWKTPKATAEAISALGFYAAATGKFGSDGRVTASVVGRTQSLSPLDSGRKSKSPKSRSAPAKLRIPEKDMTTELLQDIQLIPETDHLMFASAVWNYSTGAQQRAQSSQSGLLDLQRSWFRRSLKKGRWTLEPIEETSVLHLGDETEFRQKVTARLPAEFIHIQDFRPTGFEPTERRSGFRFSGGTLYLSEIRDSSMNFFLERMPQGTMEFTYRMRPSAAGIFHVSPAALQSFYAPEFSAHSGGGTLTVVPKSADNSR